MPLRFCRWGAKHHRWTCEILSKGQQAEYCASVTP